MIDLNNIRHIHLIGIGGVSVSAIAEILLDSSYIVTGSDRNESKITKTLEEKGIKVFIGHNVENVIGANLVVYSSAVPADNCELLKAKELNIPLIDRADMLGIIMKEYKKSIAVAGTHGKTTTTSMLSQVLTHSDLKPTLLVGGHLDILDGNVKIGKKDLMVTEACEYKENFLKFHHNIGIILNVEEDHLDYYDDIEHIVKAFTKFASIIPKKGTLVINNDDYNAKKVVSHVDCNVVTFGITQESTYQAKNVVFDDKALPTFDLYNDDTLLGQLELTVPGQHNVYNALAAIATLHSIGLDFEFIKENLQEYANPNRRFQKLGSFNGVDVIDDYAHHPTALKTTIKTATRLERNKTICVFQPHTYSRTKSLMLETSSAFNECDHVILTEIYAARETDTLGISGIDLYNAVKEEAPETTTVEFIASHDAIAERLKEISSDGDIVLLLGAGDLYKIGEKLVK